MSVIVVDGPLIIVRTPWPRPKWKEILKGLTEVMQSHDCKQKDIVRFEYLINHDEAVHSPEDSVFLKKMEDAFNNDTEKLKRFWLYDWKEGRFNLVRKGQD